MNEPPESNEQGLALEARADYRVDARDLACPLPLLRARQALADLAPGQSLYVCCTDPGSWRDFESFAAHASHRLAARRRSDNVYHYVLIKGG
ncbi:sulfurtransferase TusA family protein [Kushneria aurantia]|uniref:Sulfurtransferase TusA family protein n=1 Tax=Kushneria aurantia TaxID=504092 RepID=A0ABV6G2G3_9GAMM|nr:sulfurtransferase TusA family protein [Kushneria aurantia]